MKKYLLSLMIALLCSFNTYGQTTIPIFTIAHELLRTRATSDTDIISVLKKHKFATDKSWMPTGEKGVFRHLENITNGEAGQIITTKITYNYYNHKICIVDFSILGYNYYPIFLKYLEKNNYKLSDAGIVTVYKNIDTGYVCGIETVKTSPYDFLKVGFMRPGKEFFD